MNKQSSKAQETEAMMRIMASMFGQEILSFAVDYLLENGEDEHAPVQVLGTNGDVAKAALGIFESLIDQGKIPQVVWYVPGDHSTEELTAMLGDYEACQAFIPMCVSEETVKALAGKSGFSVPTH